MRKKIYSSTDWLNDFDLGIFDTEMTQYEYDEAMQDLAAHVVKYEWEVLDDLHVFMEAEGYGSEAVFIFSDDTGDDRFEEFGISVYQYNYDILEICHKSNSPSDFKQLYRSYILNEISENS